MPRAYKLLDSLLVCNNRSEFKINIDAENNKKCFSSKDERV